MEWLHSIREIIWPLLENEKSVKANELPFELHISEENYSIAQDLLFKFLDQEDDRRKSVESKASLFLSTISITNSLVIASTGLATDVSKNYYIVLISVSLSFVLAIYTIRTVWFSVKALERGSYFQIGFNDINQKGDENEYRKFLITQLAQNTKRNFRTVNHKVDMLVMAQEYYKRSIALICIYSFIILLSFIFNESLSLRTNKNNSFQKSLSKLSNKQHEKSNTVKTLLPNIIYYLNDTSKFQR